MEFSERKYVANLLSSERILVGDLTEIKVSIIEVFTREQPAEAYIQILYGSGRNKTELIPFTLMDGTAPIFTFSSDFVGISDSTLGLINIKVVDSGGDNVFLKDSISVDFHV